MKLNKIKITTVVSFMASIVFGPINAQNKFGTNKDDSLIVDIKKLDTTINSRFPDYAPIITADRSLLIYTSRRPHTKTEIKKQIKGKEQIYMSLLNEDSIEWKNSSLIPEPINIYGRNSSNIALSNDGNKLLVYRDDLNNNGDIYISELIGAKWSDLKRLPEPINSDYHESSASISPDGKTFYFISDRPGGIGGRDIWYCVKDKNDVWGEAVNLGFNVNSAVDEESVFIHPDGKTLFFSSKREGGLGGYDVYKTTFEKIQWIIPVNIGSPVNTLGDDVFYVLAADGKYAYYSSNNSGVFGDEDIFEIKYSSLSKMYKDPNLVIFKGTIKDSKNNPLEADIDIIDNVTNELFTTVKSNKETGKFLVSLPSGKNYGITVMAQDYLFHSENINVSDTSSYKEILSNIVPKKIVKGSSVVLNNIFFAFGKSDILASSEAELSQVIRLMNQNPNLKIEIAGYTDNIGSEQYNIYLSSQRAKAVVQYLINNNISVDRLSSKGYGFANPIVSNLTAAGREKNRRVEFIIL